MHTNLQHTTPRELQRTMLASSKILTHQQLLNSSSAVALDCSCTITKLCTLTNLEKWRMMLFTTFMLYKGYWLF